jgi:hypothetical protein
MFTRIHYQTTIDDHGLLQQGEEAVESKLEDSVSWNEAAVVSPTR